MYGLRHHVDGEEGLPGNPDSSNSIRYMGRGLLALAVLTGYAGASRIWPRGSAFLDSLSALLLIVGVATLFYESEIQDRLRDWGR